MARNKTPAAILEMRGAFKTHPERRREDPEGGGAFDPEPPQHLPQECLRAWRWIVDRLPKVSIYDTDEIAVEIAATLLARWWLSGDLATVKELRAWLGNLGFTPRDRANLTNDKSKGTPNKFGKLKS